jgi:hypothetical protein
MADEGFVFEIHRWVLASDEKSKVETQMACGNHVIG